VKEWKYKKRDTRTEKAKWRGIWMQYFYYITDLSLPVMMTIIGYVFLKYPPKEINSLYGYRTARSMRNVETWAYAHRMCGKIWIKAGPLLFVLVFFSKTFLKINEELLSLIHMGVLIFALLSTIFLVENMMKRKFR